jgi:hypothetical protein
MACAAKGRERDTDDNEIPVFYCRKPTAVWKRHWKVTSPKVVLSSYF